MYGPVTSTLRSDGDLNRPRSCGLSVMSPTPPSVRVRVLVEPGVHRLGHDEVRVLIGKMTERAVAQEQRLAAILLEREVGEVIL